MPVIWAISMPDPELPIASYTPSAIWLPPMKSLPTVSVPLKLSSRAAPVEAMVTVEVSLLLLGLFSLSVPALTLVEPL